LADDFVGVAPDGTGKKIDATSETTAAGTVDRQRVSIAGTGGNNVLQPDATGKIGVNNFPATQPVSVAAAAQVDGHSVTIGATTDLSTANTVVGRLKALVSLLAGGLPAALTAGGNLKIALQESNAAQAVTGIFWQATQPVSSAAASQVDGHSTTIGTTTDASTANTLVGLLKRILSILPAALTLGGNLKVALQESNAAQAVTGTFWQATQPVSSAAAAQVDGHSVTIGATTDLSTANTVVGRLKALVSLLAGGLPAALTVAGNLKVSLQESNASQAVTVPDIYPAAGSLGALGATAAVTVAGMSQAACLVTGTWVGTIVLEGSIDGTTWNTVWGFATSNDSVSNQVTVNDTVKVTAAGYQQLRARMSAFTSGTATIQWRANAVAAPRRVIVARANASAPALTENQPAELSLDLSSNLRTVIGMSDSQPAAGTVPTPALGAVICTLAAPGAGTYNIQVTTFVSGAQGTPVNMELRHGATSLGASTLQSVLNNPVSVTFLRVTIAAGEAITVNATAADAAVGVVYIASIVVTRVV
jgi:hypothetical protein